MKELLCSSSGIKRAAEIVRRGGVVVYPTDTVYGIGCDPFNERAVLRVIKIKRREQKPLPVLCSSIEKARKLIRLSGEALALAQRFWPGPLTIVSEIIDQKLPRMLSFGSGRLGVRVPGHDCALRLIELSGGAIVGTSANRSGLKPPTRPEDVKAVLSPEYDILLNGGESPLKTESTVVEIRNGGIILLREKAISREALGI